MKDKIIQITGKGNFSLSNKGTIRPIPLCDRSTDGKHYWVKDFNGYSNNEKETQEMINQNQLKITEVFEGKIYCEQCEMVKEHIEKKESFLRWIGPPSKTVDNRGFLSKIFGFMEGESYSIDGNGVKTIDSGDWS